jgi:hypothetical protein
MGGARSIEKMVEVNFEAGFVAVSGATLRLWPRKAGPPAVMRANAYV